MPDKITLPPSEAVTDSEVQQSPYGGGLLDYFRLGTVASDTPLLPAYWSKERDARLMEIYINNPFASSVTQTVVKILAALPFKAQAEDIDDDDQREAAEISQAIFEMWFPKVVEQAMTSLLVQDNGMFLEITGAGEADEPIEPTPVPESNQFVYGTGFRFLESGRCTRTGIDETPVRYQRDDGKEVLLHKSRVLFFADAPSSISTLFDVGLCSLSRVIQFAQNGIDVITLENESLSGNIHGLWYGINWPNPPSTDGGGMLEKAFQASYQRNSEKGRTVFQQPPALFPRGEGIEDLKFLQLKRYPEGFNKTESLQLIMQFFALGYGFETRTFWPASQTGATKADAELSHLKEKSKFLAWFIDKMCSELNEKFAPDGVTYVVDYTDDEQDLRQAEITEKRIGYLVTALNSNLLDRQTALEMMVEDEIITIDQFERMMIKEQEAEERRQEMAERLPAIPPPNLQEQPPDEPEADEMGAKKKAIKAAADDFEDALAELIEQANSGEITEDEFTDEMAALVEDAALEAWREGSGLQTPNLEQQAQIDERVNETLRHIAHFGVAVVAADTIDRLLRVNVPLWSNNVRAVYEIGKMYNEDYEYLRWVLGNAKHCKDCQRLGGQVHTREEWARSGYSPASHSLDCKGFCKCHLEKADGPSSGGF